MSGYPTAAKERIERPPIHPTVVSTSYVCLVGTLLTDLTYWRTADIMWADFSAWLISAGVILGWLTTVVGLIVDAVGHRYYGTSARARTYAIGTLIVLVLATLNMFVHTRDAWTSVVPWGLALSAITVLVLLLTTCIGWAALYRREIGLAT